MVQSSAIASISEKQSTERPAISWDCGEPVRGLSPRELSVLRLVASGLSNKEAAVRLGISANTVRLHVSSILAKLQVSSRTQAAVWALKNGIVEE